MSLLKIAVAPAILDLRNNNKLPRDGCRGEGEKGVTWKDVLIYKLEGIEKGLKSVFQTPNSCWDCRSMYQPKIWAFLGFKNETKRLLRCSRSQNLLQNIWE